MLNKAVALAGGDGSMYRDSPKLVSMKEAIKEWKIEGLLKSLTMDILLLLDHLLLIVDYDRPPLESAGNTVAAAAAAG